VKRSMTIRAQIMPQGGAMNGAGMFGVELSGGVQYVF
jgi:hypothetical protein